ncbi:ADP/ATP translocase 4 [Halotydeus destructor]|nr:ADP/ATP translocase 4 [Halotydeus destructor]
MGIRIESWVDMTQWKGTDYYWNTSKFPLSKKFGRDGPAAVIAASLTKLVTLPLDQLVNVIHVNQLKPDNKLNVFEHMFRPNAGGFGSVFQNYGTALTRYVPTNLIALALNENLQIRWTRPVADRPDSTEFAVRSVLAAVLTGLVTQAIIHPLDMARIGLIPDMAKMRMYPGTKDVVEKWYISHGYKGIYRALGCSLVGAAIYRAVYFGGFTVVKSRRLHELNKTSDPKQVTLPLLETYIIAQIVSTSGGLLTHPIDVVRRRLIYQFYPYNAFHYNNSIECVKDVVRYQGVGAFFRDLHVPVLRSVGAAVLLTMFDCFKANYS